MNGGGGNDTLWGLGGADQFIFSANPATSLVRIADFASGTDKILLDDSAFAGLTPGTLSAGAFAAGAIAKDADDRILYDAATGALYFDSDGSGSAAAVQFASLSTGLHLSASDFLVI